MNAEIKVSKKAEFSLSLREFILLYPAFCKAFYTFKQGGEDYKHYYSGMVEIRNKLFALSNNKFNPSIDAMLTNLTENPEDRASLDRIEEIINKAVNG